MTGTSADDTKGIHTEVDEGDIHEGEIEEDTCEDVHYYEPPTGLHLEFWLFEGLFFHWFRLALGGGEKG